MTSRARMVLWTGALVVLVAALAARVWLTAFGMALLLLGLLTDARMARRRNARFGS